MNLHFKISAVSVSNTEYHFYYFQKTPKTSALKETIRKKKELNSIKLSLNCSETNIQNLYWLF